MTDNSKIEVQLAHETGEWAYAVYVMSETGCIYSERFEYDLDKRGDKAMKLAQARRDFERSKGNFPGCNSYSEA